MEHTMRLAKAPFDMMKSGEKTIELRLYDEKRRAVKEGDTIVFANSENGNETLCAKAVKIYVFDSFKTLYASLPLEKLGYSAEELSSASPDDMDIYYSKEEQEKHGVLGIEVELLR